MKLTFNDYQKFARETAIYKDGIFYPALGLCGESGEVADKIKKIYRDNNGIINEDDKEQLVKIKKFDVNNKEKEQLLVLVQIYRHENLKAVYNFKASE